MTLSMIIDWKFVLAGCVGSAIIMLAIKLDGEQGKEVLVHTADAFKDNEWTDRLV